MLAINFISSLRLQEKKEYANNLMKIVDEIHQVDGDDVDVSASAETGADGDHRINSSLSSEDFNTPLAKRLVNKLRKEKRHMRKNGALTYTDAASAASESEISMRAERDENDISGVESIETMTKPTIEPSTSSTVTARASTQESFGMKRRLLIIDDDGDDDDDDDDESVSDLKQEKVKPRSGHA